jgi:hypothetical protein
MMDLIWQYSAAGEPGLPVANSPETEMAVTPGTNLDFGISGPSSAPIH